jgi:hypothetical protein
MKQWARCLVVLLIGCLALWYGVDTKQEAIAWSGLAIACVGVCIMAWFMLLGGMRAIGRAARGE